MLHVLFVLFLHEILLVLIVGVACHGSCSFLHSFRDGFIMLIAETKLSILSCKQFVLVSVGIMLSAVCVKCF